MKKTIIILIALLALTVGGLYTTFAQLDNIEAETTDYTSINPFPYEMPNKRGTSYNSPVKKKLPK